jgi:putative membrane protein
MKKIILGLALASCLSILTIAYAHGPDEGYGMGPWMMWGHGMGWFFPIIMLAFWIAVIIGIFFLVRWAISSANKDHGYKSQESALDILKKRYARGEINKEEFEERKKDLL